jgi:hypothetical protein
VKVQIVYLSAADDVDSTRDMLAWVQAPRVLLVWPDKGRVLNERLDLVKISRYASRRNIQLGLLTFDSKVQHTALELAIPVFDSLDELPEHRWEKVRPRGIEVSDERFHLPIETVLDRSRERTPSWATDIGRKKTRIPLVVLIGVTTLLILFVLPSATILLLPESADHQVSFTIAFDGDQSSEADSLWIPSEILELEVSIEGVRETTGWTKMPSDLARGSVILTNHTQDPVRIPFNTTLHAGELENIKFRTLNTVVLPSGVGSQVEVQIEALEGGAKANVPPSTISAIEGPLGLLVSVENEKATFGGADDSIPSVTEGDLEMLVRDLRQDLLMKAMKEGEARIGDDQAIFKAGIWISEIIDQDTNHGIGEVGEVLEIQIVARSRMVVFHSQELEDVIENQLSTMLPEGVELIPDSLVFSTEVQEAVGQGLEGTLDLNVRYQTFQTIDSENLVRMIAGRPNDRISRMLLRSFPGLETATVKLSPHWLPFVPLWTERISIQMGWE